MSKNDKITRNEIQMQGQTPLVEYTFNHVGTIDKMNKQIPPVKYIIYRYRNVRQIDRQAPLE